MLGGPRQRFSLRFEAVLPVDELDEAAAVDRCHPRDPHATLLHVMGPDHERLTCFHGVLENKLTGVVRADVILGPIA